MNIEGLKPLAKLSDLEQVSFFYGENYLKNHYVTLIEIFKELSTFKSLKSIHLYVLNDVHEDLVILLIRILTKYFKKCTLELLYVSKYSNLSQLIIVTVDLSSILSIKWYPENSIRKFNLQKKLMDLGFSEKVFI